MTKRELIRIKVRGEAETGLEHSRADLFVDADGVGYDIPAHVRAVEKDDAIRAGLDTTESLYAVEFANILIDDEVPAIHKNATVEWLSNPVGGNATEMEVLRADRPSPQMRDREITARLKE